jgi:K+-transporting ATPase ATPase C chain
MEMKKVLTTALWMTAATFVLTGILYPLAVTGLAQILFPHRANGSLVTENGRVVGSEWIGQRFTDPAYFQGRPSAAGADGYDPTASSGSNLGPTSAKLRARIESELARLRAENPSVVEPVPAELVTASGSGLDPDVSPEAARWQAARVAAARGTSIGAIDSLIDQVAKSRTLGLLGEPRVNVLMLNRALDRQFGHPVKRGE